MHVFSHREFPFHYESGWMAETFFTGGQMPSVRIVLLRCMHKITVVWVLSTLLLYALKNALQDDLLLYFQRDLRLKDHWVIDGTHYHLTCEAWLAKFDSQRARAWPVLVATYGQANALKWLVNWRLFFLACSELFAYGGGKEWVVSHYLMEKPAAAVQ